MHAIITGSTGQLGRALQLHLEIIGSGIWAPTRWLFPLENGDLSKVPQADVAFLCAGTRFFQACEGSVSVFRADVDGNIRLARHLLKQGTFVVFVSSDAVENMAHTAYGRNRLLVELALVMQPNVGIFRPSKFTPETVGDCARALAEVGLKRIEGLTRWSAGRA